METIEEAINAVQESKIEVGKALIDTFGVQEKDIVEEDGVTSLGLQDKDGNWKKLSDWPQAFSNSTIFTENTQKNVQADWSQTNASEVDYIKNKPTWVTEAEPSYVKYTAQTLTDAEKTQVKTNLGLIENLPVVNLNECDTDIENNYFIINKNINDKFKLTYTIPDSEISLDTAEIEDYGGYRVFKMKFLGIEESYYDNLAQSRLCVIAQVGDDNGQMFVVNCGMSMAENSNSSGFVRLWPTLTYVPYDDAGFYTNEFFHYYSKHCPSRLYFLSDSPNVVALQYPITVEYENPIESIQIKSMHSGGEGIYIFKVGDSDITNISVPVSMNVCSNLEFKADKKYILSVFESCITSHEIQES